jgi:SAM-dependent methyltransferase
VPRPLEEQLLRARFRRRGPWITSFEVEGRHYGGSFSYAGDHRLADFAAAFPSGSVLELGSLEGGHTVELVRRGYNVTAIEGRKQNARRARWVIQLLGLEARVRVADLERIPIATLGRFDAVFCSGLLYHLPEPWNLVAQLPATAPGLFLSTHYAEKAEVEIDGFLGRWYEEGGAKEPLSGLSRRSFWLTREALLGLLRGFYRSVSVVRDVEHENGPIVNVVARI